MNHIQIKRMTIMIPNKTRQDNKNKHCLYQNRMPDIYFRWLWMGKHHHRHQHQQKLVMSTTSSMRERVSDKKNVCSI